LDLLSKFGKSGVNEHHHAGNETQLLQHRAVSIFTASHSIEACYTTTQTPETHDGHHHSSHHASALRQSGPD